jgi:hypothetical protein
VSAQKPIVVVRSIHTDLVALTGKNPAAGETVIGIGFQMRQIDAWEATPLVRN